MNKIKLKVQKYFILLVLSYLCIRIVSVLIYYFIPDLLIHQVDEGTTQSFSIEYLIKFFEYIISFIFIYNIKNDLIDYGIKSLPILILTFLNYETGVVLCLILIFYSDYKRSILANEITV